jgi:hypothetical protein
MRFNETTSKIEFYYNSGWNQVAKIGTVPIAIHANVTYDAPGITNEIVMTDAPRNYIRGDEANVLVFVGGVQQTPNLHYEFSAGVASNRIYLTPSASGDAGQPILVIHNLNSTDAA